MFLYVTTEKSVANPHIRYVVYMCVFYKNSQFNTIIFVYPIVYEYIAHFVQNTYKLVFFRKFIVTLVKTLRKLAHDLIPGILYK